MTQHGLLVLCPLSTHVGISALRRYLLQRIYLNFSPADIRSLYAIGSSVQQKKRDFQRPPFHFSRVPGERSEMSDFDHLEILTSGYIDCSPNLE